MYLFADLIKTEVMVRPIMNINQYLTYLFTSGTTGIPKGVVVTHKMVITQILAMEGHTQKLSSDVHLSYLPIAHAF